MPQNKLNAHIKRVHLTENRQYICDLCGKTVKQKSNLALHIKRKHISSVAQRKTYNCRYCPETFQYTNCRNTHEIRFHTFDYRYTCIYRNCEKKFVDQTQLKSHLTSHTGEKKYRCEDCGERFRNPRITVLFLATLAILRSRQRKGFVCTSNCMPTEVTSVQFVLGSIKLTNSWEIIW